MSKRAAETTIKTSIRIRPCSQQERETFPGPSPVQAAPGEVRLFQKTYVPGSGRNSPSNLNRSSRPATPTSPHVTPRGASSPSLVWRQQAAAQQLSSDYQSYAFANVFGPEEGNEAVYNGSGCRDVVAAVLGGCNGTIFVYGQTGAGKTHTMDALTDLVLQQLYASTDDAGSEVAISVSAVELYNEVLRCLLSGKDSLQLRLASGAGSVTGVVLEGAEERPCGSIEEAAALVTMAKAARAVGETRANARSSRSHLIVRVKVEVLQLNNLAGGSPPSPIPSSSPRRGVLAAAKGAGSKAPPTPASVTFSMLNLVDLAGSERIDKSGSADTPLRLREALNINKSLLCLGNVVTALAERSEGKRAHHIPYRDSKLTRLLEDSLGGNATTALVACITQLPEWHLEQSRNTLEFAARAARVVCKPQRNVLNLTPPGGASGDAANLIASLQAEVEALKRQLVEQHLQQLSPSPSPSPQLHALSVQPVSSSSTLWDGCGGGFGIGSGGSRKNSGTLAGVAEHAAAECGDRDEDASSCSSPTSASCPASPSGRHSPTRCRSGGWTARLRMSLGGGGSLNPFDSAGSAGLEGKLLGARGPFPSRIPSPKHSLFSALASPRVSCRVMPLPAVIVDQPLGPPVGSAAAAAAAAGGNGSTALQTHSGQPSLPAAAAAAGDGSQQGGSSSASLPASAHTTSIISRTSGTQRSLLWKLLQQPHPHDRHPGGQPLCSPLDRISSGGSGTHSSSGGGGGRHSTQSLKSAGLLITSSGNAASAAAAVAASAGSGAFARWATFSGGRASPVSCSLSSGPADRAESHDGAMPSHPVQLSPQVSLLYTGRSSIASRRLTVDGGGSILASSSGMLGAAGKGGAGAAGLDSAGCAGSVAAVESRVAAAEAAMALRDHIIKQLVLALQQKKAEIRSLKEQLAAVLKQLESSEGQEEASKAKLRELAEGIQMLAAARQEEFEKWKGHLVGLEAALQAAQKEATDYRDESQSLVQQLTELQACYDSLQTVQRSSLVNLPLKQQQQQQVDASTQQQLEQQQVAQEQLAGCLSRLQAIESALQEMLRLMPASDAAAAAASRARCHSPRHRSRACSPAGPRQQQQQLFQLPEHGPTQPVQSAAAAATAADGSSDGAQHQLHHSKGEVESHSIQTISTRVFDGTGSRLITGASPAAGPAGGGPELANSLAAAAEEAAAAARMSHVEFVLAELQELLPLVRSAADAALAAGSSGGGCTHLTAAAAAGSSQGGAAAAAAGGGQLGEHPIQLHSLNALGTLGTRQPSALQTGSTADNSECKQQDQAVQTKEAKAAGVALIAATKCHKCDSLKPLLVIMQKLKDEVVLLKAAMRTKDSQLTAAEDAAAGLRADLLESRQQVGALRERIDELSEDLELARTAAAAASAAAVAAAADSVAAAAAAAGSDNAAAGSDAAAERGDAQRRQQQPAGLGGDGLQGGYGGVASVASCGKQVPLMDEDTPLEALHAQILQSWQALAMPFAYRCAFVLGPNSAPVAGLCAISTTSTKQGTLDVADAAYGGSSHDSSSEAADMQTSTAAVTAAAEAGVDAAAAAAAAAAAVPVGVRQAPWEDRVQCQAHIALLACLHQYHEDEPAAAEQQREVLAHESRVVQAGLAALPAGQLEQLLQHWAIATGHAPAAAEGAAEGVAAAAEAGLVEQRQAALLAKLWVPSSAASAEVLAADSAAACQLALAAAPPAELAAVSLRCNASVIAAASNALADAAS